MKTYGTSDEDLTAENLLYDVIKEMEVQYIILHPRTPIDARPCRLPGSLLAQAVLQDGQIITVRQSAPGGPARRV